MKRIHIFLFLLVTCFILNGCGTQNPSDSGPEAKDHTTATGNTTLPESTISWFNTEYFNSGDGVNMRNMLLSSQYSTIADIDLFQLFYNGIPEVQIEISDEEKNTLVCGGQLHRLHRRAQRRHGEKHRNADRDPHRKLYADDDTCVRRHQCFTEAAL